MPAPDFHDGFSAPSAPSAAPAPGRRADAGADAVPLASIPAGAEVVVIRFLGGRRFQHRLTEMGLRPGVRFRVLNRGRPGPFLIGLKDSRLMLGHGMAGRVLVRPAADEEGDRQ